MRLVRCAALALVASPLLFASAACTRTKPAPGGLMLAVETDMNAPKDIGALGLYVSEGGQVIFAHEELVAPTGEVHFPATLAVVGAKTPGATVKIRVVAFKVSDDKRTVAARVVRDAITTLPLERQALLRLPILWLSDGSASGSLPTENLGLVSASSGSLSTKEFNPFVDVVSSCPVGQTDIAGVCTDSTIDSSQLPTFSPNDVFGAEGGDAAAECFAVTACFGNHVEATLASGATTCTATLPPGTSSANVNVAVRLPPGSDGVCTSTECLVALDRDDAYGWAPSGDNAIKLPAAMCKKLGDRPDARIVVSSACATKTSKQPACSPATASPSGTPTSDAGALDPSAAELVDNAEPGPVDIKTDGDHVFFVAAGGRVKRVSKYRDATGVFPGRVEYTVDPADPVVGYRLALTPKPIGNAETFFAVSTLSKNSLRVGTIGGTTNEIATQTYLGGLAVLGTSLYWLAGTELRSCDLLARCATITPRLDQLVADALAVDEASGDFLIGQTNGNVVLYSSAANKIAFTAPAGGNVGAVAIAGSFGVFTVPPADETGTGSIYKVARSGGTPELLASGEAIGVDPKEARVPHSIATDGRFVYWTTRAGVRAINIDGGTPVDLATGMPRPRGIAVDDVHAYWTCLGAVGEPHGYVYRKAKF
jgi:hypothetical protein